MPVIRYEDVEAFVGARDNVVRAAMQVVDSWETNGDTYVIEWELVPAVRALRSLNADRGVRDPSTPGEQEAGQDLEQRQGDPG